MLEVLKDATGEWREAYDRALAEALEQCGMLCETYAKKACPVDTGRLRGSYVHELHAPEKYVAVGTNVVYGKFVEMGTRRMKAQPHLRPAAADHADKYGALIRSALGK